MNQTFTAGKNYSWIFVISGMLINCMGAIGLSYKLHETKLLWALLFLPVFVLYALFQKQITSITVENDYITIYYNQFLKGKNDRFHKSEVKTILEKQARLYNPPTDLRIVKKKTGQELFRIRSGKFSAADFAAIHRLVSGSGI